MGGHGPGALAESTGLNDHDRLGPGEVSGRAHELAGVRDPFDVHQNASGVRVAPEVIDEVAEVDLDHRAHGNERGEPDVLVDGHVENGGAEGPALGEERHAPGLRDLGEERAVQMDPWPDDAEAVRADDTNPVLASNLEDLVLERLSRGSGLLEAGREDDDPLHSRLTALLDQLADRLRGSGNDREVDRFGDGAHVGVGLDAKDLRFVIVDEVGLALELTGREVRGDRKAHRPLGVAGPEDRDGLRLEHLVQVVRDHGFPPRFFTRLANRRSPRPGVVRSSRPDRPSAML